MPYIIAEPCTNDGACVEVCPVACIHTKPGASQHYIDPDVCIECEQCEIVCPVDAIFLHTKLPAQWDEYQEINAAFFRQNKAAVGPVPMDVAFEMIASAQAYARRSNFAISAAIVDEGGGLIAATRMDEAEPRSTEQAFNKAYTSSRFHVATHELVPEARKPWMRSLVVASRGRILAVSGGLPILDGIVPVGAIGIAGASTSEQDTLCCRAALSVWENLGH